MSLLNLPLEKTPSYKIAKKYYLIKIEQLYLKSEQEIEIYGLPPRFQASSHTTVKMKLIDIINNFHRGANPIFLEKGAVTEVRDTILDFFEYMREANVRLMSFIPPPPSDVKELAEFLVSIWHLAEIRKDHATPTGLEEFITAQGLHSFVDLPKKKTDEVIIHDMPMEIRDKIMDVEEMSTTLWRRK